MTLRSIHLLHQAKEGGSEPLPVHCHKSKSCLRAALQQRTEGTFCVVSGWYRCRSSLIYVSILCQYSYCRYDYTSESLTTSSNMVILCRNSMKYILLSF